MNKFNRSDLGAKAAWKGYSSQTTYISNRLLTLTDNIELHPEKIEDLLIAREGNPIELVQIKNLTSSLSLSDLSPKEEDSFFRRCLSLKETNPNLVLRIVSFGEVGSELLQFSNQNSIEYSKIEKKLLKVGYSKKEIAWISSHLIIEKVDESILVEKSKQYFSERIETMAAPHIVLDILTQYVATLSRYSNYTTKAEWNRKIQQIGLDLASLRGIAKEYGNSFLPLSEFKISKSKEDLAEEFLAGVNALPQHIRQNLDIERPYWLSNINESFSKEKIVIVKGVSGQGKSTLCYRYLQNFYSENDVMCVQSVTSESQAQDIVIALNGIAKTKTDMIVYLDVSPLDTSWTWICEKLNAYGSNLKLLISIREEDYRRNRLDLSQTPQKIIDLQLARAEAELIFNLHPQTDFRSFSEAWRLFGQKGPMMEFVYLLNRSETLEQRLEFQVKRITDDPTYTDEWLKALLIVSYAGRFGIEIDFQKLLKICPIKNASKVLFLFEKEYLVKVSRGNKNIESLHVLRAEILSKIILDYLFIDEKEIIFDVVSSTFSNVLIMLISYYYNHTIDSSFIDRLSLITFNSWTAYGSVIKSLLWYEIRELYFTNKSALSELDAITSSGFLDMLLGDQTGYYPEFDGLEARKFLHDFQPENAKRMEADIARLPQKKMNYTTLDQFMAQTNQRLPVASFENDTEVSSIGYSLFWLANRNVFIEESNLSFPNELPEKYDMLDSFLNLAVGMQYQGWSTLYLKYSPLLRKMVMKKYNVVYLEDNEAVFDAMYILRLYESEEETNQYSNESIMALINALRRLDITKEQYNAKMIGDKIHTDFETPDYIKTIKAERLPWLWITEINRWFSKIHGYDKLPEKWEDVEKTLISSFKKNDEVVKMLMELLDYLFRKGNLNNYKFRGKLNQINKLLAVLNNNFLFYPKQSVDKFGINLSNVSLNPKEGDGNNPDQSLIRHADKRSEKDFDQLQNEVRQKLSNFYQNFPALIDERIRGIEPISQKARLTYINLMDACEILPKCIKKYPQDFPLASKPLLNDYQLQNVQILGSIWSRLFLDGMHHEKSIIAVEKGNVRKYLKRIEQFWQELVPEIAGIDSCKKSDTNYLVTVDLANNAAVIEDIFRLFKRKFPEVGIYTFENSLWINFFDFLEIHQKVVGNELPMKYKIPSDKFAHINFDYFDKTILMYGTNTVQEERNDLLSNFQNYQGNSSLLAYCYNHLVSAFHEIKVIISSVGFNEDIYLNWAERTRNVISSGLQEIVESLEAVNQHFEQTFGEDEHNKEIIREIQGICLEIAASTRKLFSLNEIDEYEKNLEDFQESKNVLLGYLQVFNEQNDFKYQVCLESDI
ncbi:hypothetical protein [Enterococcus lactis]|uniref:hypothetical protein n=1 Tax=Enterococcus lactis TaxID=357441 RepID=UPI0034E93D07